MRFSNIVFIVVAAGAFLILPGRSTGQTARILFDATKGEMAGNADWVIDADQTNLGVGMGGVYTTSPGHQSNPQQTATPAQSGITMATTETYWTGALSSWGIDCVNKGYAVETLPWNGQITYGSMANAQDLTHYDVFVIDEPNILFSASEKTALVQFVRHGGGLFIIADHNNSDRNGDGWDSPNIWNDVFANNGVAVNPFGLTFDLADFSQTTTNISATAGDSIIHGAYGNVVKAQWAGGTTMTLSTAANPTVKGVVYKTGTTPGSTNVMVAYGYYGSGKVAAMGDSSPADDGTGNPGCTLYNGYWMDAGGNHRLLIMNITIWLATHSATMSTAVPVKAEQPLFFYPNPSTGRTSLMLRDKLTNARMTVYTMAGSVVQTMSTQALGAGDEVPFVLPAGTYLVRVESDQLTEVMRLVMY